MNTAPRAVAQQYFDAIRAKEMDRFVSILSPDIVWHQPGKSKVSGDITGLTDLLSHFGKMAALTDGTFHFSDIGEFVSSDSLVVIPLRFSARHRAAELNMAGVDVMRIADGKIAEVWLISQDQVQEDEFWDCA